MSKGGAQVRALACHQFGLGANPGVDAIGGLSLLLVLSLSRRDFSPGTPVFPSPQKPTFSNSNSTRNQVDEEPLSGFACPKSLFVYLIYIYIYIFIYLFITPRYDNCWQKRSNCISLYYFTDHVHNVSKMQTNPRGSEQVQHALAWKQGVVYWRESVRVTIPPACLGVPV